MNTDQKKQFNFCLISVHLCSSVVDCLLCFFLLCVSASLRFKFFELRRSSAERLRVFALACVFGLIPLGVGCDNVTPKQALELMNNPDRPDARREGIAAIATRWSWGKQPPYPNIYQRIAQHDSDVTVRAMAIRALNICRDSSATKIFIAGLQDDNEQIRLESAKALANVPDPDAIPILMGVLTGSRETLSADGHRTIVPESKDVRIAAADALGQYRKLDVARTLVGYLNERDFAVAWQSRQSLITLTGQDLYYDQSAWLQYLIGPSKPFG